MISARVGEAAGDGLGEGLGAGSGLLLGEGLGDWPLRVRYAAILQAVSRMPRAQSPWEGSPLGMPLPGRDSTEGLEKRPTSFLVRLSPTQRYDMMVLKAWGFGYVTTK